MPDTSSVHVSNSGVFLSLRIRASQNEENTGSEILPSMNNLNPSSPGQENSSSADLTNYVRKTQCTPDKFGRYFFCVFHECDYDESDQEEQEPVERTDGNEEQQEAQGSPENSVPQNSNVHQDWKYLEGDDNISIDLDSEHRMKLMALSTIV